MTAQELSPSAGAALLAIFEDAELTGVFVWKFGVTLSFNDKPIVITVENNAEVQSQGRTEIFNQEIIVGFGARMLSFVGHRVVDVQTPEDKVFVFSFDEGTKLTLRPDASGYESYQISCSTGIWIG